MILVFPDLDTFRLALTGGVVPTEVSLTEAAVSFGDDGRIFVDTPAKLPRKTSTELTRLGVVGAKRHPVEPQPISCWLQVLPVTRDPAPPQLSTQAPVLFELPSADQLPTIVGEMLRLGNDRQSYRWIAAATGSEEPRLLLRVIGPPYYTLLRALDETSTDLPIRAYTEQAPRVWVQIGYSHPFASQIKLPEGQVLCIRPPRDWGFLEDGPFQDVYEILQFQVPNRPVEWEEAAVEDKLTVPLRLVAGNAAEPAELWVLRGDASALLDAFVRDADERVTQRLKFAVASTPAGEQVIVLRTTQSKQGPPHLPFSESEAIGFKPYWKLPNLYIPAGTRLHPNLRRDAVRKLLADDTDTLVWLFPGLNGTFTPETLPEDSFRPLEDWVDYIIETHQAPLKAWVESASFEFEHFVCSENPPPKPRDDKPQKPRKGDRGADDAPAPTTGGGTKTTGKSAGESTTQATAYTVEVEVKPPSEWEILRAKLEEQFHAIEGPLDAPARLALWPELAITNAGKGDHAEATLCWVNAMWESDSTRPEWVETWTRSELRDAEFPLTAGDLEKRMKSTDPTPGEMRKFLAVVLWAAHQKPIPDWLPPRLPAVQRYLEAFEKNLPIRAVWLAASRLTQLSGADVLGLARVRDRLLQRLLEEGLSAEKDLPLFLRTAGMKDSKRIRAVREKSQELHQLVRTWAEKSGKPSQVAVPSDGGASLYYIDLLFAFGFAKLGESTPAKSLVENARGFLDPAKPDGKPLEGKAFATSFLFRGYKYRIDQATANRPHTGLLPAEMLAELQEIHKKAGTQSAGVSSNPNGMAHYVVARLREQSRILEPQEKLDPYAEFMKQADELKKALTELPKIKDPQVLAKSIRELYRSGAGSRSLGDTRFLVLLDSLPLAARVGEQFTAELLGLVAEAMQGAGSSGGIPIPELAKKQGQLLERALYLAGHFDRRELVHKLVEQFTDLVSAKPDDQKFELINVVAGQCLRSLRKLGLRDEIDRLLRKLQDAVLKGQPPSAMRAKFAAKPDVWGKALQTLLHIAGGWLTFGLTDQATPILDEARNDLLSPTGAKLSTQEFPKLAQAYIAALGQGPADLGLPRIAELFRKIDPTRITNGYTTAPFYSRFHLNIAEEVVLALVSDDFALGPTARKWLDEDEYLVRRRIHRDMKRHLAGSGL